MRVVGPVLASMIAVTLALPASAPAQQIEAAGGLLVPLAQNAETYSSQYEPTFTYVPHTGAASQQLALDPARRAGLWGSVTFLVRRRVGIEVRGAFSRAPVAGANGPYAISLTYQTRQPPDYVLREYHIERSTQWPATEGSIDHLTFSGSLVGVIGDPQRLSVRLSGGLALTSITGYFEPLAYTTFTLGGHAVVFPNEFTLRMRIQHKWSAGFEGGAEATRAVSGRAAVVAGLRVRVAPAVDIPVRVGTISGDIALQELTPADVDSVLAPRPLHWRPVPLTFFAGIRIGRF